MNRNPYPNRPHPVGVLSYALEARHLKNINPFRHIAMLEYGEAEVLYDMPRIVGEGDIANLGHASGGSAVLMAMCLRELDLEGHIYSVDIFKGGKLDPSHSRALEVIEKFNVSDKITLCRGTTREVVKSMWNQKFKFVFIDADHTYEGVLNDFKDWSRLIGRGGFVGFHDTNQEFSHRVLAEELLDNPDWFEHKHLHINRIRIFEKLVAVPGQGPEGARSVPSKLSRS
jgi:predicted O-methyltransferase YrrM